VIRIRKKFTEFRLIGFVVGCYWGEENFKMSSQVCEMF
jgi:hypothetical protein